MALNSRIRRALALSIPIFSAAAFLGIIEAIFQVGITENLMKTGVTLGLILGILNVYLTWLIHKHQVP